MPIDVSPSDRGLAPLAREACAAWFGPEPPEVGPEIGAGFSGAPLARVRARGTTAWFVLKAFAAGTSDARAEWLHGLVRHLAAAGVAEVPQPLAAHGGATVVADVRGGLWEMVPFVTGTATDAPSQTQAAVALRLLARVHVAAAMLPGERPGPGPSAGVIRRIARAGELLERPWRSRRPPWPPGAEPFVARLWRAASMFEAAGGDRALAAVAAARASAVPLQPVLRDVWSAHVLFGGGEPPRVAGIVDVHAAGIDSPATDLARLLGSWCRDTDAPADPILAWPEAVAAYESVRPLTAAERDLVPFLHAAGVVCGLDNWFRWTLDEGRTFAAADAVAARIDRLLEDLPAALAWLAECGQIRV